MIDLDRFEEFLETGQRQLALASRQGYESRHGKMLGVMTIRTIRTISRPRDILLIIASASAQIRCDFQMVKAAVLTSPGHLEIRNYPRPEVKPTDMLVRVEMAGVCGTEVHYYRGREKALPYPIILGHEFSVTIEEMGKTPYKLEPHGESLSVGDRVALFNTVPCGECYFCRFTTHRGLCQNFFTWGITAKCKDPPYLYGGWAEYMYVDQPKAWMYKLPKDMSAKLNMLVEPMTTATRALERAFAPGGPAYSESFGPAKSVVIQGAGAIGTLSAAAAKISGARQVIMVAGEANRLKIAKKFGVDETIDIKEIRNSEERIKMVKERFAATQGPDVVVEATGVPAAVPEGLAMVRPGGAYVEVGHFVDAGEIGINPFLLCSKDITLFGSYGYSEYDYETAIHLLYANRDRFPFEELITHEFPLVDAEKAVLAAERGVALKAAIVP